MNINDSVYWDVDRSVGAKVGRENNYRIESGVGDEVGSDYGEGV